MITRFVVNLKSSVDINMFLTSEYNHRKFLVDNHWVRHELLALWHSCTIVAIFCSYTVVRMSNLICLNKQVTENSGHRPRNIPKSFV